MAPRIVLRTASAEFTVPPSPEGAVIGRSIEADVMVPDLAVSRRHARVVLYEGVWWVQDLGSTAGTFLDGARVADSAPVHPGQHIGLGEGGHTVAVEAAAEPAPQPEPEPEPAPAEPAPAEPAPPEATRLHPLDGTGPLPGAPTATITTPDDATARTEGSWHLQPGQVLTIGRERDCDIQVEDLLVSRRHVRLEARPEGFAVTDLGSSNGTYLEGQRVESGLLTEGQRLAVGHATFRVRDGALVMGSDHGNVSLTAHGLGVRLGSGKVLLQGVDLELPRSSLLAVIGPSGAGKSTLLGALTGSRPATEGEVLYDGLDLYASYDQLRHRIGIVPQDDIVHRHLTVRAALGYAAELRFPEDVEPAARAARVAEVMEALALTPHAGTRIDRLSGGQRKRVSVAMELLTEPSLLFLDEPTSGLDPGLDKRLMTTFRELADGGRTVAVITHSVANLDLCDRVLLLAPGGRVAYFGPPAGLLPHFGADNHADVFEQVSADPEGVEAAFARTRPPQPAPARRPAGEISEPVRQQSPMRQWSVVVRRQLRVMAADPVYVAMTLAMPVLVGLLSWLVPGDAGFREPSMEARPSSSPMMVLLIVAVGAAFMGVAGSIRDLVAERPIFSREAAVGLRPLAYMAAKVSLLSVVAVLQAGILVAVTLAHTGRPEFSYFGLSWWELTLAMGLCAAACVAVGLCVSAVLRTLDQVMPTLVVAMMVMLVLSGGLFPVVDRAGLEQAAWLSPTRWGYAMAASSVDLQTLTARRSTQDPLWDHELPVYLLSALVLLLLHAVASVMAWLLVERSTRR
ncbi:ABC transporter ATP-binding protein [Kytococcus schroeteri]|uniref:ABC transporter ATP-binding protein n=1 Tax=Kytococcus schroeteri TaxID=138300 RepID=A0A2I1PBP7_9MICO|nr:FHA domain-containing protein [Kytococcus schroeteri]PKZ42056.1 ABC transporter ATP-binding protein [Kytococcus schroeteri]